MSKTKAVQIGNQTVGGGKFTVIAGPCSIESRVQFTQTAEFVKSHGASMLRGGMYKLRTSPESFQGLGAEAYALAREIKGQLNMPFISEVTDPRQIGDMASVVDIFQVGSRNMHNYALLKELGETDKPVLLKRGFSGLIKEWILAAEYIEKHGNPNVLLCERGIRTFETTTRNTFDINAIAYIKQNTHYPIIADPSHATGDKDLVIPMSLASAAAGADGIIVEVHPNPAVALSDGFQALTFEKFEELMLKLKRVLGALETNLAEA